MRLRYASVLPAFAAAALVGVLSPDVCAPQPVPKSDQFQVNLVTVDSQENPSVAMSAGGGFVVVWDGPGAGAVTGDDVFARRFDATGVGLDAEFRVNSYTVNAQDFPAVASADDGDFVVVWSSFNQDGQSRGIFGRRFNSAGAGLAAEFRVNAYTASDERGPDVAMDGEGGIVVVWESAEDGWGNGVFARRFDSGGVALGAEFMANTYTLSSQSRPSVAADADGDFVVAWEDDGGLDGQGLGVFARRFSSTGVAIGSSFQVNAFTLQTQAAVAIDMADDGSFVAVWYSGSVQDGSSSGVFARRFDSTGLALGAELQVNAYTTSSQAFADLALAVDGSFIVTWQSFGQDGNEDGVFARRFTAAGAAVGGELHVNTYTDTDQAFTVVDIGDDGDFVIAWASDGEDGSGYGVFARRFGSASALLDLDGNGATDALTDGLLLLRHLFGFTGSTLVTGAVDLGDCTRCDAPAIEAYIELSRELAFQGGELQANTHTLDSQISPVVGMDAGGDFVVVWASVGAQDGSNAGVFGRRFDSGGSALAVEFQVNSYTLESQWFPAVGMDADGDFVVAWHSVGQDGSSNAVFARRFGSSGAAIGGEFQVNTFTASSQAIPAVGVDADGDFVIAWQSDDQDDGVELGVFARRFAASGTPLAVEFQVNTNTTADQGLPAVGMAPGGAFVVAWQSNYQDGSAQGVFARRFDAMGAALGAEFRANVRTSGDQTSPAVAIDAGGAFAIAWRGDVLDGSGAGVFARRFDAAGAAVGDEFQVNAYTPSDQEKPRIVLDQGGFLVVWQSFFQDGFDRGVFARRFSAADGGLGPELQVNIYATSAQGAPAIAASGAGDFVVAWNSLGQDGAVYGAFARRLVSVDVFDIDGNRVTDALTDGLLALRFLFGFTGATLVNGAVAGDCNRCTAPAIEGYLQTLI